jgi:hypothetical protein
MRGQPGFSGCGGLWFVIHRIGKLWPYLAGRSRF